MQPEPLNHAIQASLPISSGNFSIIYSSPPPSECYPIGSILPLELQPVINHTAAYCSPQPYRVATTPQHTFIRNHTQLTSHSILSIDRSNMPCLYISSKFNQSMFYCRCSVLPVLVRQLLNFVPAKKIRFIFVEISKLLGDLYIVYNFWKLLIVGNKKCISLAAFSESAKLHTV